MKNIYFLSTCSTCKNIMDNLNLAGFEQIDIKEQPLNEKEIEFLKSLSGSYESLFSKRAKLYREKGLKDKDLTEDDFKNYLLEHYTFLKRPVLIDGDEIYIGSSPKTKKALIEKYGK